MPKLRPNAKLHWLLLDTSNQQREPGRGKVSRSIFFQMPGYRKGRSRDLCRKFGVTPVVSHEVVDQRMKRGMLFIEAATTPLRGSLPLSTSKNIDKYRPAREAQREFYRQAKAAGITGDAVDRVDFNNALREMGVPLKPDTVASLARKHGLDPATVRSRIKNHGWSQERALTTPICNKGNSQPSSLHRQAIEHGVSPDTVWHRVNKQGMTIDEALTFGPNHLTTKARAHGINPSTFFTRKWSGMSESEALSKPIQRHQRQHGTTSMYNHGCRCEECRAAMSQYYYKAKMDAPNIHKSLNRLMKVCGFSGESGTKILFGILFQAVNKVQKEIGKKNYKDVNAILAGHIENALRKKS